MSKQREVILRVMRESDDHMTAEEIYLKCKESGENISVATVYRNLGIMSEQNVIRKISIVGEPDHYDKNITAHEHMICDICNKVKDVHISNFQKILEDETGIRITSYDLCLHYICPECQEQNN